MLTIAISGHSSCGKSSMLRAFVRKGLESNRLTPKHMSFWDEEIKDVEELYAKAYQEGNEIDFFGIFEMDGEYIALSTSGDYVEAMDVFTHSTRSIRTLAHAK